MVSQLTAYSLETLSESAIYLLKRLIATPSFSREEDKTALLIEDFFRERNIPFRRTKNNIWTHNRYFDPAKPTLLLNSHHDTVKPNPKWTLNPFHPLERDGKLFGLGSNDAGGCLVSLMATFCHFYDKPGMAYNIVMAATAEEELSGRDGLELLIASLTRPSLNREEWLREARQGESVVTELADVIARNTGCGFRDAHAHVKSLLAHDHGGDRSRSA